MLSFLRNFKASGLVSQIHARSICYSSVCSMHLPKHTSVHTRIYNSFSSDSKYRDPQSTSGDDVFKTVTTKPHTPEEMEEYAKLLAKDEAENNTRRLIQDIDDEGVFVNEPHPEFKDIEIVMNEDGSVTFKNKGTGDSATTSAPTPTHHAEGDKNVLAAGEEHVKIDDPRLIISLTCDECNTRLTKSMPKRSYEKGVVLLRCDCCKTQHLIADHLGWFGNSSINVEMLMREKGQKVVRTNVDEDLDEQTRALLEKALQDSRPEDLAAPAIGIVKNTDENEAPKSLK